MSVQPGQMLSHYRLVEKVSEGGMGVVWKAVDTTLERDVAIKILPDTFAADPERLARFRREAKLLASLNHPNIATVHGLHEAGGIQFIAMELVPGEDLAQRLARGAMPVDEALEVGRQIAEALGAAHERGVIHRDLKPANVRLDESGKAKVLDFGLAKAFGGEAVEGDPSLSPTVTSDHTRAGVILGTAAYMSPEQARGRVVDQRTDIWAFGCLLFECLSGRKAFPGETVSDTLAAVLKSEPDWERLPVEAPEAMRRLLRRCLAKDPSRRLHSIADARLEIEEARLEPIISREGSRPAARWRPWILVSAVAALAIVALSVTLMRLRPQAPEAAIKYRRLTHQSGFLTGARFAADGQTIVYSGVWEGGASRLHLRRLDSPVATDLDPGNSRVLAVSSQGEIGVLLTSHPSAHLTDLGSGTLATVPLTGGTPRALTENVLAMDWDPSGERIAVVRSVGNRYQLEFPIGHVLHETSGGITFPRVSPSADMVAFLDHPLPANNRGFVAIVAPGGEARALTVEHEDMSGLAWSPDGSEIWFSGADEDGVALFGVSHSGRERVLRRMPGDLKLHDVSRDGRVLVSSYLLDMEIAARAPGEQREREISWLGESFVTDLSADGKSILFSERNKAERLSYDVWLRHLEGSAPIRLGPGIGFGLSSDGKWVLSHRASLSSPVTILPTGAGEARVLQNDLGVLWASWIPGDQRVVLAAVGPDGDARLYSQEIEGGPPSLISDEIVQASLLQPCRVSPDGRRVAASGEDGFMRIFPLEGGEPRLVPGAEEWEAPLGWTEDGRALFVWRWGFFVPARVYRLNVETGERSLWREIIPADPTGVTGIVSMVPTPDGRGYAYSYFRGLETLYLLTGLK